MNSRVSKDVVRPEGPAKVTMSAVFSKRASKEIASLYPVMTARRPAAPMNEFALTTTATVPFAVPMMIAWWVGGVFRDFALEARPAMVPVKQRRPVSFIGICAETHPRIV